MRPQEERSPPSKTYENHDKGIFEGERGRDGEHGTDAGEDGGHEHHLAGEWVHGQPRQMEPERRQVFVGVQGVDRLQHLQVHESGTRSR